MRHRGPAQPRPGEITLLPQNSRIPFVPFSPHRYCQVLTLLAAQYGQFHLVTGWVAEANISQELALGHGCRLAVYPDDDIADAEACLAGPGGALGDHVLDDQVQATGSRISDSMVRPALDDCNEAPKVCMECTPGSAPGSELGRIH